MSIKLRILVSTTLSVLVLFVCAMPARPIADPWWMPHMDRGDNDLDGKILTGIRVEPDDDSGVGVTLTCSKSSWLRMSLTPDEAKQFADLLISVTKHEPAPWDGRLSL